jgi:hypothetical protein
MTTESTTPAARPVDARDFAIGVLSITAMILLVGVILVSLQPTPVRASGMTVSAGAYTMTVGQSASVDEEFLYVLDGPAEKMIAYRFNTTRQTIDVIQGIDLSGLRAPTAGQSATPAGRRPPTRGRRP